MSSIARALALGPLAAAVALASAGPSLAGERQLFEKTGDWEIERGVGDTGPNPCLMSRSYRDKDGKAENLIIFGLDRERVVLVLGHERWSFGKDEAVKAAFALGGKVIDAKSSWIGEGNLLKGAFPEKVVPELRAAERIELRFKDTRTAFEIPGFADAYDALRRCDEAKPPAAAPSEARTKAYVGGLIAQATIKACSGLAVTAERRSALDAKLAALQGEMAAADARLRDLVAKRPVRCPPAAETASFQAMLQVFLDRTPEDFAAFMDTRSAAEKAPAGKP